MIRDFILFLKFAWEMFKEYTRHYPEHGDSWKRCGKAILFNLLTNSINDYSLDDLRHNPSHFIDIANFSLFCYYRFNEGEL